MTKDYVEARVAAIERKLQAKLKPNTLENEQKQVAYPTDRPKKLRMLRKYHASEKV